MKTTRKTEQIGKQYYELDENGKIKPVKLIGQFISEEPINKGFCKLWHNMRGRKNIMPSIDIDLFFYLIYRSDSKNRGQIYMKSLAKLYKTSAQRISRHIHTLIKSDLIKMNRTGHFMLNPLYIFKGKAIERNIIIENYQSFTYDWK